MNQVKVRPNLSTNTGVSGTWITLSTAHNGGRKITIKKNASKSGEIVAASVFCRYACWKIIQNASAVFHNVFPHSDHL